MPVVSKKKCLPLPRGNVTFLDAEQIHRQPWAVKPGGTGSFCQTCPETTVQSLQVSGSRWRAVNWSSESEMMTLAMALIPVLWSGSYVWFLRSRNDPAQNGLSSLLSMTMR